MPLIEKKQIPAQWYMLRAEALRVSGGLHASLTCTVNTTLHIAHTTSHWVWGAPPSAVCSLSCLQGGISFAQTWEQSEQVEVKLKNC